MARDNYHNIHPVIAIAPLVTADGSALVSAAIDTIGYESVTFVVMSGDIADADAVFNVQVKEGDDATQGNHTPVVDAHLLGTEAAASIDFSEDNAVRKIGYVGEKRYVSIEIDDVTANSSDAHFAVLAILGHPHDKPTPELS